MVAIDKTGALLVGRHQRSRYLDHNKVSILARAHRTSKTELGAGIEIFVRDIILIHFWPRPSALCRNVNACRK